MTIGENIRKLRKEKKLTQKQLGELCGMYESQIRKYELGTANPKIDTIRKIASALNVYMNELIVDWSQYSTDDIKKDLVSSNNLTEQMEDLLFHLNERGQEKAIEQVELLTKIPEYKAEITTSNNIIMHLNANGDFEESTTLNAANEQVGSTPEDRLKTDQIMEDDSEWE